MEYALVLLIVAAAGGYLLRQTWRTWAGGKTGCGSGCACPTKPESPATSAIIPLDQLTLRRR